MMDPTQQMFRGLKDTFHRMTDLQSAVQALQEFDVFRQKVGEYNSEMAMRMAMDPKTSPCKSFTMLFVQWMRVELEYFCLAAYKGSQSVVAQET